MVGAALLVDLGVVATAEDAMARIRAARPGGNLTRRQRAAVEELTNPQSG
jgi:hypothetical protein